MSDNYVGVFKGSFGIYVYVGTKEHFLDMYFCEFLHRIDLKGMNLKQLYEDSQKEAVFCGAGLVCYPVSYPNNTLPPEGWKAISMKIASSSIDDVVESAKRYFEKFMHGKK